jgi:hypothetical protein
MVAISQTIAVDAHVGFSFCFPPAFGIRPQCRPEITVDFRKNRVRYAGHSKTEFTDENPDQKTDPDQEKIAHGGHRVRFALNTWPTSEFALRWETDVQRPSC